jgi:septum formation protein
LIHEVLPADVDETLLPGEYPEAYAERLARAKAEKSMLAGTVSIGSDTIVVVDGDVLGKPRDEAEAAVMLRRLSGRSHTVMTAVAVAFDGYVTTDVVQVGVTFRSLRDEEIQEYIRTGEPMDKAGAYGIQGYGATIVDGVDGDYFAVMGLPLNRLIRLLESVGLVYRFGLSYLSRQS